MKVPSATAIFPDESLGNSMSPSLTLIRTIFSPSVRFIQQPAIWQTSTILPFTWTVLPA